MPRRDGYARARVCDVSFLEDQKMVCHARVKELSRFLHGYEKKVYEAVEDMRVGYIKRCGSP